MAQAKAKAKARAKGRDTGPVGSSFDDWLREEGIREEVRMAAAKAVLAWQLAQEMKRLKLSKAAFAARLGTSKSQVYRVLDPENETVSIETLKKAAAAVGKKLRLELVDAA
ncbi:MAG TPA: helix-turn-helix domain-containing protein [Stellaceae bacterium]